NTECRKNKRNAKSLVKEIANLMYPVLAGTSRNKCLQAAVQSKTYHRKYQVIYACDSGNSKRLLTQSSQKNIVCNKIYLRHKDRRGNWQSNFKNLPVGDFYL